MALVSAGYELSVNLSDTSGSVSTLRYELQSADFATAQADSATIIAALDALTLSAVSGYRIAEVFYEDALALPANAENAVKASVTVQLAGTSDKGNFRIPAPAGSMFNAPTGAGFNQVATSAAAVEAYGALFEVGAEAFISDGQNIAPVSGGSILSGRRVTVRSTNP